MARNEALVFGALDALQPARPLRDIADRSVCYGALPAVPGCLFCGLPAPRFVPRHDGTSALSASDAAVIASRTFPWRRVEGALRRLGPTQAFNVLHLRLEEDWVQHCARWESINDGPLLRPALPAPLSRCAAK